MENRDLNCQSDVKNCIDSSVQSHLSTTNSQQRLRATASNSHDTHIRDSTPHQHREQLSGFTLFLRRALLPPSTLPHPTSGRLLQSRPWSTLCFKWALFTYCMLSLAILSATIYKSFRGDRRPSPSQYNSNIAPSQSSVRWLMDPRLADSSPLSAFEGISTAQRLSRISSLQPPFEAFEPYLIQPSEEPEDPLAVTACLWSQEPEDFDMLYSWASLWSGPISFLMTTTSAPNSEAHIVLLKRIRDFKTHLSIPGLSLHLLHLTLQGQGSPNTFLNIARLFSATKTVMLVPANLSFAPLITSDVANRESRSRSLPIIVTTSAANLSTFSTLPSLSPLIIQLGYPVWCIDRFFLDNTRSSDWTECLWQFWLDAFGEFRNVQATIRTRGQGSDSSAGNPEVSVQLYNPYDTEKRTRAPYGNVSALDSESRHVMFFQEQWQRLDRNITKVGRESLSG